MVAYNTHGDIHYQVIVVLGPVVYIGVYINNSKQPANITIDGVLCRGGFYGDDLLPVFWQAGDTGSETLQKEVIHDDGKREFRRMDFANRNRYKPFGLNRGVETRDLLILDRDISPRIKFFRESKDGFFTSSMEDSYHIVDGKLLLEFEHDHGHGDYKELVAVEVPDELGQYFIDLMVR